MTRKSGVHHEGHEEHEGQKKISSFRLIFASFAHFVVKESGGVYLYWNGVGYE
jgi:hypothetical protein